MTNKKAIIIGAGIAGLASAIRVRKLGYDVNVYEANSYPGGKLDSFISKGFRFDMGPSLFTMPSFVEELFELHEKNPRDYFNYQTSSKACHYFFEDGSRFFAPSNTKEYVREASKVFAEPEKNIQHYFDKSKKKYDLTAPLFLEKSLHQFSNYLSKDTLKGIFNLFQLDINKSLHQLNEKSFENEKLTQLFDRYATYNGSSPYSTPGIMSLIPHLEHHFGVHFPIGGMKEIPLSLYKLAKEIGIQFHFNKAVDKINIENGKATGIITCNKKVDADIVISNMDIVPTYRKLLKNQKQPHKTLQQPRSSSALIFYWSIDAIHPELDLHNILFSKDYKEEFSNIFDSKNVSNDPTVYIHISSKIELDDAPKGCENWFVMINVPTNEGQDWDEIIARSRQNIIQKISKTLNKDISSVILSEKVLDPREIESKTSSYQGSLYGASSNNKFAAFLRHPNFSTKIQNLYFCGGSVHPGGGIPLCLLSAKIVSDIIQQKHH